MNCLIRIFIFFLFLFTPCVEAKSFLKGDFSNAEILLTKEEAENIDPKMLYGETIFLTTASSFLTKDSPLEKNQNKITDCIFASQIHPNIFFGAVRYKSWRFFRKICRSEMALFLKKPSEDFQIEDALEEFNAFTGSLEALFRKDVYPKVLESTIIKVKYDSTHTEFKNTVIETEKELSLSEPFEFKEDSLSLFNSELYDLLSSRAQEKFPQMKKIAINTNSKK